MGCDAVLLGKWALTLRRNSLLSS